MELLEKLGRCIDCYEELQPLIGAGRPRKRCGTCSEKARNKKGASEETFSRIGWCEACNGPFKAIRKTQKLCGTCRNGRPCENCGSSYASNLPSTKYCSSLCANWARRKLDEDKIHGMGLGKVAVMCRQCGCFFNKSRHKLGGNINSFCSAECDGDFKRIRQQGNQRHLLTGFYANGSFSDVSFSKIQWHCCDVCDSLIANSQKKYCSRKCAKKRKRRSIYFQNGASCKVNYYHCDECLKFCAGRRTKFCSSECLRRFSRRQRRHLLRSASGGDRISISKLMELEGIVCKTCGVECVVPSGENGPNEATIDHVKPLSKGGDHSWENVQLLCRSCNTKKGATW